jgi:hypothetical protein
MTMSQSDYSSYFITSALSEVSAAQETAAAKMERLLTAAFEDRNRAIRAYTALLETRGPEETIKILNNERTFGRMWHFGWMRGGLLAKGNRDLAMSALRELPDTIREHHTLIMRQHDLQHARRALLERADNERFQEHAQTVDRSRSRH